MKTFNDSTHSTRNRKSTSRTPKLALLAALMLVAVFSVVTPASATITVANLKGSWQATMVGQGGCGFGSKLITFTLDSTGVATDAVWSYHTVSCGDAVVTGQTFTITTLNSDGTGTATLTIGGGVTLTFSIQVSSAKSVFNLVDITDASNFEEGVAIKQ